MNFITQFMRSFIVVEFYYTSTGSIWISSEMKGLNDDCEHFESFPPGHLYSSKDGELRRWYNPPWFSEAIPSKPYDPLVLRQAFEKVNNFTSIAEFLSVHVISWLAQLVQN